MKKLVKMAVIDNVQDIFPQFTTESVAREILHSFTAESLSLETPTNAKKYYEELLKNTMEVFDTDDEKDITWLKMLQCKLADTCGTDNSAIDDDLNGHIIVTEANGLKVFSANDCFITPLCDCARGDKVKYYAVISWHYFGNDGDIVDILQNVVDSIHKD